MGPPAGTQRPRHLAARRARRPLQPSAARERRLPGPRQPRPRIGRTLRAGRDNAGHHRRRNRMEQCRVGGRRAPLSQRCARAVARGLAEPRHRALPRALLAALRRGRRPGLRRLGRAQARGERCQELDQGRAVARGDVPLSARGRLRGGELRAGLQIEHAVEHHAKAPVLDQGGRALEDSVRRSRMKLKYLFALSTAAVIPAALAAETQVDVRTNVGTIRLELYPEKAPKTVENFLKYVRDGHYNGTIFHRVIPGFMIQGGGFTADMAQKPVRPPVPIESKNGLKNDVGTVAMARTSDPNS